jgi:hypothetical protein
MTAVQACKQASWIFRSLGSLDRDLICRFLIKLHELVVVSIRFKLYISSIFFSRTRRRGVYHFINRRKQKERGQVHSPHTLTHATTKLTHTHTQSPAGAKDDNIERPLAPPIHHRLRSSSANPNTLYKLGEISLKTQSLRCCQISQAPRITSELKPILRGPSPRSTELLHHI